MAYACIYVRIYIRMCVCIKSVCVRIQNLGVVRSKFITLQVHHAHYSEAEEGLILVGDL